MPEIVIPQANRRDNGNFPEFRIVNMLWEKTPTTQNGVALLSRPPLVERTSVGNGPIYATIQKDGLFDGDLFTLSGDTLYRGTDSLGTINGDGPVSWATSASEIVITRGESAWSYDGTDLEEIAFPDSANVRAVAEISGLFLFVREGDGLLGGRVYWSTVNDARTINALDYINAETEPDHLRDIITVGDNAFLLGTESIEIHMLSGNPDAPLTRQSQRGYSMGVIATGCAVEADNAVHLIGKDFIVYRLAEVGQRISDHGLEERIQASSTRLMFTFRWNGHLLICVKLDSGTWGFDLATGGQWTELATYGRDAWAPQCSADIDGAPIFGDDTDGTVWEFGDYSEDDCGVAFQRVFPAVFALSGQPESVYNVLVDHNPGATDLLSGQGSDPIINMRTSRDGGRNYGTSRQARLGRQGQTRRMARFGACGMFDDPGAVFEFTVSDPCPLRISRVRVNDSMNGRGRGV
jgi:hypothetical protein